MFGFCSVSNKISVSIGLETKMLAGNPKKQTKAIGHRFIRSL